MWKRVALVVCGIAVAVAAVLWTAVRASPAAESVAVESSTSVTVEAESTAEPESAPPIAPALPAEIEAMSTMSAMKALIPCSTELDGAQPHVAQVGNLLAKTFGIGDIGGAVGRHSGDHGAGLALDLMTPDAARGDAIADFVLANKERFGVTYVIWQQRYNDGNGWSYMEDRGSPTANHYDHVHISFAAGAAVQVSC